ncbi:MAG: hypothetical protein ACK4HV_02920, partial [Parachlamydiaceae bacterium]
MIYEVYRILYIARLSVGAEEVDSKRATSRDLGEAIFEIGIRLKKARDEKLTEIKGGWNSWCENDLGMTRRYANMFVKIAGELSVSGKTSSQLGV